MELQDMVLMLIRMVGSLQDEVTELKKELKKTTMLPRKSVSDMRSLFDKPTFNNINYPPLALGPQPRVTPTPKQQNQPPNQQQRTDKYVSQENGMEEKNSMTKSKAFDWAARTVGFGPITLDMIQTHFKGRSGNR